MKIKPIYRQCVCCEEQILDGDEMYVGTRGYYCSACLDELSVKEFLELEGECIEVATLEYPEEVA